MDGKDALDSGGEVWCLLFSIEIMKPALADDVEISMKLLLSGSLCNASVESHINA